ncbi:aldehyde dehydrogenase family protein [Sphingobium tyrosinilyticum]|uniref:Aldehyde dehydrogenase family protein n=1 Tax=Sphingobium tyrosinilyticum TaxID=2715436 RepID=A0ABV9F1B5_9SPHN
MTTYKLLINGALVDGEAALEVLNPATGQVIASVQRASKAQAEQAIAAAKAAQPAWAATSIEERRAKLRQLADAIDARTDEIARTMTQEQGKPLTDAIGEIGYASLFARYFADMEIPVETVQDDEAYHIEVHYKPLGVVAGITPWNFPFLIPTYKLAPAVLLGNAFILKPAPTTPLVATILGEIASTIFPAGIVSVLVDDNDLGPLLSSHPDIAKISFTGSTATGKRILEASANTLKRLTLELGGNDAAIVLDDADIERTARGIAASAFGNAGQVCVAVKRVYVPEALYDTLADALGQEANALPVGDGLEQGTRMGPMQNQAQYAKAKHYLEIAHRDGKVIAGGEVHPGEGLFVQPTIVRDIEDGSPLVEEEQFAPILPLIRYGDNDLDSVIARVNSSEYGLGGSIWSTDIDRAAKVAQRVDSGTVWINHASHFGPHIPFGGAKQSGIGSEFTENGLLEFAQRIVISVAH